MTSQFLNGGRKRIRSVEYPAPNKRVVEPEDFPVIDDEKDLEHLFAKKPFGMQVGKTTFCFILPDEHTSCCMHVCDGMVTIKSDGKTYCFGDSLKAALEGRTVPGRITYCFGD